METRENITPKERLDALVATKKIQAFYKKERERFNAEITILDLEKALKRSFKALFLKGV